MMKSLNIKDPEAHRLATAIAQETGETMTHVVREALQAKYDSLPGRREKACLEELTAIAKRITELVKDPHFDPDEDLYDGYGLPK